MTNLIVKKFYTKENVLIRKYVKMMQCISEGSNLHARTIFQSAYVLRIEYNSKLEISLYGHENHQVSSFESSVLMKVSIYQFQMIL